MSEYPRRGDDEPDFAQLFQRFLADADNPAMADAMRTMGFDQQNPAMMGALAGQLRALFDAAPTDGVNRSLCESVAHQTVTAHGDAVVGDVHRREVADAVHVADLWLDDATAFSAPQARPVAWSRADWVAQTMGTWVEVVAPVAHGVNGAIGGALRGQFERFSSGEAPALPGLPPGLDFSAMLSQFEPMLGRMSSSMFGAQIGKAVGTLAGDVLSATEVGLPLLTQPAVALLPANIEAFAQGLEMDVAQVRLFVALRESARIRLFAGVPWLGPQVLAAVQAYARDISIDTEGIERKLGEVDPSDPQAMQQALSGALFSPEPSERQKSALARLETLLALVEGWVDVVASRACAGRLPQAEALSEAIRRRRAAGGPAEAIFGELVGLEMRPRRLRDAANLFAALESAGGAGARDGAWAHPDVAPTAADLDDVLGYVERARGGSPDGDDGLGGLGLELDAALEQILSSAEAERSADDARRATETDGPVDAGPWPRVFREQDGAGGQGSSGTTDPKPSDGTPEDDGPDAGPGRDGGGAR